MPADPQRIQSIFLAALETADPADRAALLSRECGDDAELRQRVEVLLQAHDRSGSFLDKPAVQPMTTDLPAGQWIDRDAPPVLAERPGMRVGRYKLLQQIGEGGFGVVYMAEQQEPVRRMVALKIIKPGMDSDTVVARFEAERQALALMDHQNIARVFDGGTTESGRPFFVMELVKGIPITRFCDENRLTPRERLQLFASVCEAVQHAHQKGVIHRDLKPSNVLVTLYDGKPVPKVIDFGVAKALHQKLTERTMFTAFGAVVGTLEYMSPEQAEMNALDVDTRSDVYSLGVLLYELLTGTTPLERERLRKAVYTEMLRLIREEEPLRPSMRISGSGQALARISAQRKTEPAQLARLVRGELDWIVMKALEKDRGRRYETATGLARDVERYLKDEPVEACPPTVAYQMGKFARKYKKALATTTVFAALLVAGIVVSAALAVWATSAEQETNQQRIASDEAKQEALDAKVEAVKQLDEARLIAYASGMKLAQHAFEENNVARARELLEEVPNSAAGRNLRGFEWYYLSRLIHSEILTLTGHADRIQSVSFSPDGQRLASGSVDKTVKIWDSVTGKELFALKGHGGGVTCVAFSPDGQCLASGSGDKTVKVWDSVVGKELFSLEGHSGGVSSVAFSPDGQRLASASEDGTVKIWDSVTGKELFALKGHGVGVTCVAFSPDGQHLASASADKTVKVWDGATGKELFTFKGHEIPVTCVAFSPDGQRLASGQAALFNYATVKVWNSTSGKEEFIFKGPGNVFVNCVAFSPDGQCLVSGRSHGNIMIWDSETGQELFAHALGDELGVESVAFSPDGQRLASTSRNTVRIWNYSVGKELFSFKNHRDQIRSMVFSPDGQRLCLDGTFFDSITGRECMSPKVPLYSAHCVAFSRDGQRMASGGMIDVAVKIWDSVTGKVLFDLKGHPGTVESMAFSPDGQRLASGSGDGSDFWTRDLMPKSVRENRLGHILKIWDSATGKEVHALKGHSGGVTSVAFSPDGQRLACANRDFSIHIWETTLSPEMQERRAAHQLVAGLFRQMGQRTDVLERLRTLPAMNPTQRQAALAAAQTYPENPDALNTLAWQLVNLPGRAMSDYRKAVRYSEAACQLQPKNGLHLNTLGVAYYRVGDFRKALETLQRSDKINQAMSKSSILAFLAMTEQRLGHEKEARTYLQQLQEKMKDSRWAKDVEAQGFLHEAEAMMAKPKTPAGK